MCRSIYILAYHRAPSTYYLALSALCLALSGCTENMKAGFLAGVVFDQNEIKITRFHPEKKTKVANNLFNLTTENSEKLKINSKVVGLAEAKKIIQQKSNEIKMLFLPQQVPYFGQISKDISCTSDVEVDRVTLESEKGLSLNLNLAATEYLIYGTCIKEQEIYKSQLLFLYCKKIETLYEIKYFYDRAENYKKTIASCE